MKIVSLILCAFLATVLQAQVLTTDFCETFWTIPCEHKAQIYPLAIDELIPRKAGSNNFEADKTDFMTEVATCVAKTSSACKGECQWCLDAGFCAPSTLNQKCTEIANIFKSQVDGGTGPNVEQWSECAFSIQCNPNNCKSANLTDHYRSSKTCYPKDVPDKFSRDLIVSSDKATLLRKETDTATTVKPAADSKPNTTTPKTPIPDVVPFSRICKPLWETECANPAQAYMIALGGFLRDLHPKGDSIYNDHKPTYPYKDGAKCFTLTNKGACEEKAGDVKCTWCEKETRCLIKNMKEQCASMTQLDTDLQTTYATAPALKFLEIAKCLSADKCEGSCSLPGKSSSIPDVYGLRPSTTQLCLPKAHTDKLHHDLSKVPDEAKNILSNDSRRQAGYIGSTMFALITYYFLGNF